MRRIPNAVISGVVMSVSDKPADPEKDKKAFRLVKLSQIGKEGDAETIEIKVFNGMKVETGKAQTFNCELRSWMMKGDRGDYLYGLTATAIEGK
ncbi:MAG: hypothetical protein HZB31_06110 [Nitrospirae bacterium]|nr:hypothetical protein [Nitrospirota bacterium]